MAFTIRDAAISDYDNLMEIFNEVYHMHYENRKDIYVKIDDPFPKEYFDELLKNEDTRIFLVEDNQEELVGYSIVQITTTRKIPVYVQKKLVYIDDFAVKSKYQKKGIGKLLFNHIEGHAERNGVESIQLNVWEFNEKAIKFYESMGMKTRNRTMEKRGK